MKSSDGTSFYVTEGIEAGGIERVASLPTTAGPWGPTSQHGGPPAALLTRAIEALDPGPRQVIGRFTMELLGPVPVGPLSVHASVVRPGRSVEMCEANLYDESTRADDGSPRQVARATAWRFPDGTDGPGPAPRTLDHSPADGRERSTPGSWARGYLDAVEWRWVKGAFVEAGPALVWMRPRVDLVDGEAMSPVQRLMTCVDSASGVSAQLDPAEWAFLNTELTVHLLRPPVGDWVCLDAETTLGAGRVGMATSEVYDEQGLVARSAQALLVARR